MSWPCRASRRVCFGAYEPLEDQSQLAAALMRGRRGRCRLCLAPPDERVYCFAAARSGHSLAGSRGGCGQVAAGRCESQWDEPCALLRRSSVI